METATVTLSDFLLARIAEDEAAALAADDAGRDWEVLDYGFQGIAIFDPVAHKGRDVSDESTPETRLMTRYSPSRVLAECEKNKRIVTQVQALVGTAQRLALDAARRGNTRPIDEKAIEVHAAYILPLLALPYADHPDYQTEWRP